MAFFRRLVKRSKGDKGAEINYFDTPTLTGRGKHGKHDKSEPLAALYPNYRNVFFSRLDQDFTPVMELPKTFRIALPSGQLISRSFPNNTSVYEVVSKLASEYDFDPTRVLVTHKGDELPPAAVLLADISPDGTIRLSFRKQRANAHQRSNSSSQHKYNTAPQKHLQHQELNNNQHGFSTEKSSKHAKGASSGEVPSEPSGPPQQVKVDVTIPELNNKMVIRISPLLTCRDLLNIVCHNKKLDRSQREIRLATGNPPNVASSSQSILDNTRLVVTVGQSFVVCQAHLSSSPNAARKQHNHYSTPTPTPRGATSTHSVAIPAGSGPPTATNTGNRRMEMSAPSTPLYGTKEKKKRLSFFGLMKNKRNKTDDLLGSSMGNFDSFPNSPDIASAAQSAQLLRNKLHHSPSLDGVLDEQFAPGTSYDPTSIYGNQSDIEKEASTHFASHSDVTTSSFDVTRRSNDAILNPIDRSTLPTVMGHSPNSRVNQSSSNLQSFNPAPKLHRSVETVYPPPNSSQSQKTSPTDTQPTSKSAGASAVTTPTSNSQYEDGGGHEGSAFEDQGEFVHAGGSFNESAEVSIRKMSSTDTLEAEDYDKSPSPNYDSTERNPTYQQHQQQHHYQQHQQPMPLIRKENKRGKSSNLKGVRSNLRVMSYSSTPDIVTEVARLNAEEISEDERRNASLKLESGYRNSGIDHELTLSSDLLLGPPSSPKAAPRKIEPQGTGSVGVGGVSGSGGGPPRRKAPPPPPKKTATLSSDGCYDIRSNNASVESLSDIRTSPPAIPKRMALNPPTPEDHHQHMSTFGGMYTPNPIPRMSSLQNSRGELPPSVVKMRQKQQNGAGYDLGARNDPARRLTLDTTSTTSFSNHNATCSTNDATSYGHTSGHRRDGSDSGSQEVELVIPPPPDMTPPVSKRNRVGLASVSSSAGKRPLSTCESVCSCATATPVASVAGSQVDLYSQCCSCRSSNITLLPESEDNLDNVSDVVSVRSETSSLDHFGAEMDNLVAMAEFALSQQSLPNLNNDLSSLDQHHTNNDLMTSFRGERGSIRMGTSSLSIATQSSGGQATPKAITPVNASCEVIGFPELQQCTSDELKSIFKSLQSRLTEVTQQLMSIGEYDWLSQINQSKSTQTDEPITEKVNNSSSIEPPLKFTDPKRSNSEKPKEQKLKPAATSNIELGSTSFDSKSLESTKSEPAKRTKQVRKRTKSRERLSKEFDEYRIKPRNPPVEEKTNSNEEIEETLQVATEKTAPANQGQTRWRSIESLQDTDVSNQSALDMSKNGVNSSGANTPRNRRPSADAEINLDDVIINSQPANETLDLYVPEPNDHDFYISFGNHSPTLNSPKLRVPSVVVNSDPSGGSVSGGSKFIKNGPKSRMKPGGSMDNLSRPPSTKKSAAPKPPRIRSISNLDVSASSLNSTFESSAIDFTESVNSSIAVETDDDILNGDPSKEKSPKKIVPGAVKAKRALFEAYNDTNLNNFRVRKSHDGSHLNKNGDKQRMVKAASTSDLVWAAGDESPRPALRYKKNNQNPNQGKINLQNPENDLEEPEQYSATVGRSSRNSGNFPPKSQFPRSDKNEQNEEFNAEKSDEKQAVAKLRNKFANQAGKQPKQQQPEQQQQQQQKTTNMKSFGSKMNHLL